MTHSTVLYCLAIFNMLISLSYQTIGEADKADNVALWVIINLLLLIYWQKEENE